MKKSEARYDTATLFGDALEHLFVMAQNPGAKDHAWWRAKDLERAWPDVYSGLPQKLAEKMKELKE